MLCFSEDSPAAVFGLFDVHLRGVFRQKFFDKLGPFDETESPTVEIILVTHVVDFLEFLDAIEVEMTDAQRSGVRW